MNFDYLISNEESDATSVSKSEGLSENTAVGHRRQT